MNGIFIIEDEQHAEPMGEFRKFVDAAVELVRLSTLPWDEPPNRAPCTSWKTCGRHYDIVEYDFTGCPWQEVSRVHALTVSHDGPKWAQAFLRGAVPHEAHGIPDPSPPIEVIHVPLVGEGVETWRPVPAQRTGGGLFRILDVGVPDDEDWRFLPGTAVRCSVRNLSGGEALVVDAEA